MVSEHVETFKELDWDNNIAIVPKYDHSYELHLNKLIQEEADSSRKEVLSMLLKALCLTIYNPESSNSPFTHKSNSGTRTPAQFTQYELDFYQTIIMLSGDTWLVARLADILWLWVPKGRNPDWARLAIDSYTSAEIQPDNWLSYQDKHWERALRLSIQLKDKDRVSELTTRVLNEVYERHTDYPFMVLWMIKLLVKTDCCTSHRHDFFSRLFEVARECRDSDNFYTCRMYIELATQISAKFDDLGEWLESLMFYADCYVKEGDSRFDDSAMVANSFYEQAIEAYRRVPNKYRGSLGVDELISQLKHKLSKSGDKMLDEMATVSLPISDIEDIVDQAKAHVSGKVDTQTALLYFCGVLGAEVNNMDSLRADAAQALEQSVFKSLVAIAHISKDGRVIKRTPAVSLNGDKEQYNDALNRQMVENYLFNMSFLAGASLLPALNQVLEEHVFSRELLESLCFHSPLVPNGRERTMGLALWLGFEFDFSAALNLLCPQIENIVRVRLKEAGEHTTIIEKGAETEIGLSALVLKPKFEDVFGDVVAFELKAIFTDNLGCNFRNEVAHGLLSDDQGQSYHSMYAWWYVLRMICHSLVR